MTAIMNMSSGDHSIADTASGKTNFSLICSFSESNTYRRGLVKKRVEYIKLIRFSDGKVEALVREGTMGLRDGI